MDGLSLLQKQLFPSQTSQKQSQKPPMPIFSFITQLIHSLKEYLNSQFRYSWAQFILSHRRPQTGQIVRSWSYHMKHSLQAQLLQSLLMVEDSKKCRLFLRLRKYVLQMTNIAMLDQIVLRHEDVITIVHRMFPSGLKKEIMAGVKQIFMSYKVADARIYACVFVEFIMSVYDSMDDEQQSFLVGDNTKLSSNIVLSNFSTINKFSSNLHRENGLYRKLENSDNSYTIIETKFLPQKLEKQRTKFQQQPNGSQYYSNSINFSQQNSQSSKGLLRETEKQNQSMNQNFSVKKKIETPLKLPICIPSSQVAPKIKIEDDAESSQTFPRILFPQRPSLSICRQMQGLTLRNEQFKHRLLSGKTSVRMELSLEEEDSINETINVIHNSIVRNRRDRS